MRGSVFAGVLVMLAATNQAHAQEPPLNVAEWSSAIEILQRARSAVEKGWYQITAIPRADCLATALEKGWRDAQKSLVDFDYARLAVNRAIHAPPLAELTVPGALSPLLGQVLYVLE
jgi:hypothetical protein